MKTLIVYYSLSGTTRAVATALAKELGAEIEEIRCDRYRASPWSAVKIIYDIWRARSPQIMELQHAPSGYDLFVVGGPVWVQHIATPVRAYLESQRDRLSSVAFFVTLGGAGSEAALGEMERFAGKAPTAKLAVREKDVKSEMFAAAVSTFAAALREGEAA